MTNETGCGRRVRRWLGVGLGLGLGVVGFELMAAGRAAAVERPVFPLAIESYQDGHLSGVAEVLRYRAGVEPFNVYVTLIFLGAIVHTFLAQRFRHWAHLLDERAREQSRREGQGGEAGVRISKLGRLLHFLGEVEAIFGIWVIPLVVAMTMRFGPNVPTQYVNERVNFVEPIFVVVIMSMSLTRPVLRLAEQGMRRIAGLGGGSVLAWWLTILTAGPLLGSFITEPAAMAISASLLADQFYAWRPRPRLAYATLGLLFVNVSIGGTLTHFAAPPVLMVAGPWGWDTPYMFRHFGLVAVTAVVVSNGLFALVFRRDFAAMGPVAATDAGQGSSPGGTAAVPPWITLVHLLFMAFAVVNAHNPATLVGAFLFFLAFFEVTEDCQGPLQLRAPLLVGFFLAGLVIHGGLQQWWISPVLGSLQQIPLYFGSLTLTAFNDNAAITYLATLVPDLSESARQAVVAGAVTGGGLTVIANAPNPAGQAILNRFFPEGISPLGLLLGALGPTAVAVACFFVLG